MRVNGKIVPCNDIHVRAYETLSIVTLTSWLRDPVFTNDIRTTKLKSVYLRQCWPVCLGVGLPSRTHDKVFLFSENWGFLELGHSLWQDDGPVIYSYNCFWALPEESLSGPSPVYFTTIFYCLIRDPPKFVSHAPSTFISPRNKVA
jgi:hypothetical protein